MWRQGEMKIWIIISQSCSDCDRMSVAVLDHEPTEEEKYEIELDLICCTETKIIETEINNDPIILRGENIAIW
jgi:hypothetical protein